jgi:hypothetical protein
LTSLLFAYTSIFRVNAAILDKLESLPKPQYRKSANWPKDRPKQSLSKDVANRFFSLVETCEGSLVQLLANHPDLPNYSQLDNWRRRHPWFNDQWKVAQQKRADFLAERCADLALNADPKTAHVVRVKFDVYRWLCSRFHPSVYGDKPEVQQSTVVNVGVSVAPERLNDLRLKLDSTRSAFSSGNSNGKHARLNESNDSPTPCLQLGDANTVQRKPERKT